MKKKSKSRKKKSLIYTKIEDPLEIKKDILRSAILSAKLSKHSNTILKIRQRRIQERARLSHFTKELRDSVKKLIHTLPKMHHHKHKSEEEFYENFNIPLDVAEISELERELDDVNKKIDSLDF